MSKSQRLCPRPDHVAHNTDCCSPKLERALLVKTTEELREVLSGYLDRWAKEIRGLQDDLRAEFFRSLEAFRDQLNKTLCSDASSQGCEDSSAEIMPRFQLTIEQLLVGPTEGILDISAPIDNLILQLLIDTSCSRLKGTSPSSTSMQSELKQFNRELKCRKFCQERLNVILEFVMNTHGPTTPLDVDQSKRTGGNDTLAEADRYKLWFTSELLFSVRLNRLLLQALELAESLLEGLKSFNPAQGICMVKLMRMHRCALCSGEVLTRPCPQLCFAILSDCFRPLSELQTTWSLFTGSVASVIETMLTKPHLSLTKQMRHAPKRMITYYHSLLRDKLDWLEPRCPATKKLFLLLQSIIVNQGDSSIGADDVNTSHSYENLLKHMQIKMNEMTELWMRVSLSLCTESPHLVPASKDLDQCWNGTSRSRFHSDRCDFCDNSITSPFQPLIGGVTPVTEGFTKPTVSAGQIHDDETQGWISQELHLSAMDSESRRANDILVRAPGDLQWISDMLLNEIRAYHSISSGIEASTKKLNGNSAEFEERLSTGMTLVQNKESIPDDVDGMDDSLRSLVYTSMLGWNVAEMGRKRQTNEPVVAKLENNVYASEQAPQQEMIPPAQNLSAQFAQTDSEGSGMTPDWMSYQWHQPNLPAQDQLMSQPVVTGSNQYEVGSGYVPTNLEYADYPSVNTFHNFINTNNLPLPIANVYGGYADDEDFRQPITLGGIDAMSDFQKPKVQVKASDKELPSRAQFLRPVTGSIFVLGSVALNLRPV